MFSICTTSNCITFVGCHHCLPIYWKGDVRTECSWIIKTLFPQKLSGLSFIIPATTVELQMLKLWWLLKVMFRCLNDGISTMQSEYQSIENVWCDQITLFLTSGWIYVGELPVQNTWPQQRNTTWKRFSDGLGNCSVVVFYWSPYDPS